MSSWYNPKTRLEAWVWSGAAAKLLSQHSNCDERLKPRFDQAQYRRLWWSCFIRDQLISLASQRPPRMTFPALNISMISEKDLRASRSDNSSNNAYGIEHAKPCGNTNKASTLAIMFVELAKLSVILNRFLQAGTIQSGDHKATSRSLDCVKMSSADDATLAQLLSWYCRLHDSARYSRASHDRMACIESQQDHVLQFHQAVLVIPYYLTLIRANDHSKDPQCDGMKSPSASRRLVYARREASKILQDLIQNDTLRHMPTDLIESLLPFATTILLDRTIAREGIRDPMLNRIEGFKQCLEVMRIMMTQDRLRVQPQNDYRVSLLEATCTLYAKFDGPREDSSAATESRSTPCYRGDDMADALAIPTMETETDHLTSWASPIQVHVVDTPKLTGFGLTPEPSEPADPSEQFQVSDWFEEDVFDQEWHRSHHLPSDISWIRASVQDE
jgi:hypothetical protein